MHRDNPIYQYRRRPLATVDCYKDATTLSHVTSISITDHPCPLKSIRPCIIHDPPLAYPPLHIPKLPAPRHPSQRIEETQPSWPPTQTESSASTRPPRLIIHVCETDGATNRRSSIHIKWNACFFEEWPSSRGRDLSRTHR